jgi:hypothetical protein
MATQQRRRLLGMPDGPPERRVSGVFRPNVTYVKLNDAIRR